MVLIKKRLKALKKKIEDEFDINDELIKSIMHNIDNIDEAGAASELEKALKKIGIDIDTVRNKFHKAVYEGFSYRFVNPKYLNKETIDTFRKSPGTVVLNGDMKDANICISRNGTFEIS